MKTLATLTAASFILTIVCLFMFVIAGVIGSTSNTMDLLFCIGLCGAPTFGMLTGLLAVIIDNKKNELNAVN